MNHVQLAKKQVFFITVRFVQVTYATTIWFSTVNDVKTAIGHYSDEPKCTLIVNNIANAHITNANIATANIADAHTHCKLQTLQNAHIVTANIANAHIATTNIADANIASPNIANVHIATANSANAHLQLQTLQIHTLRLQIL